MYLQQLKAGSGVPPITQGQMSCCQLCFLKARSWVCASACSHMTAELQVMQKLEYAGDCSLRGCVTAEMQGRADPRPLCDSSVAEIIQQVKMMLLLRLAEGDVMLECLEGLDLE